MMPPDKECKFSSLHHSRTRTRSSTNLVITILSTQLNSSKHSRTEPLTSSPLWRAPLACPFGVPLGVPLWRAPWRHFLAPSFAHFSMKSLPSPSPPSSSLSSSSTSGTRSPRLPPPPAPPAIGAVEGRLTGWLAMLPAVDGLLLVVVAAMLHPHPQPSQVSFPLWLEWPRTAPGMGDGGGRRAAAAGGGRRRRAAAAGAGRVAAEGPAAALAEAGHALSRCARPALTSPPKRPAAVPIVHRRQRVTRCSGRSCRKTEGAERDGPGRLNTGRSKRAGTSSVNAFARETTMERQVHFQSSD